MTLRELFYKINYYFETDSVLDNFENIKKVFLEFQKTNPNLKPIYHNSLAMIYEKILKFLSENKNDNLALEIGKIALNFLPQNALINYFYSNVLFTSSNYPYPKKVHLKTIYLLEKDTSLNLDLKNILLANVKRRMAINTLDINLDELNFTSNEQSISLCMIVKNEEDNLKECLESVKNLVDEIIIIDTGSSDKTKEIASKYTKNVFNYIWDNDFSKARNESLKYSTKDWILFLDADEVLNINDIKTIKKAIQDNSAIAYNLKLKDFKTFNLLRLFRNLPEIFFRGRIHEQVTQSLIDNLKINNLEIKNLDVTIYHKGYNQSSLDNKINRNIELLEKSLLDENIITIEKIYYLNKLLFHYRNLKTKSEIENIINSLSEIIHKFSKNLNFNDVTILDSYLNIVEYFIKAEDYNKALKYSIDGMNFYQSSPYFLSFMADIFLNLKIYPSCKIVCENCIREIENDNYLKSQFFSVSKDDLKEKIYICQKNNTNRIKISACIIAKDEDEFIEKCIKSVIDIVDEVIVLDTGSKDNTVQIAKESGAKVFYQEWKDNFSHAKNKAIDLACGDWILFLDADEYLINSQNQKENIRFLAENNKALAYNLTRIESEGKQRISLTRMFRKHNKIRFEGMIHEQINPSIEEVCEKENLLVYNSSLELEHYGYLNKVIEKKETHQRNIRILKKAIDIEKDNFKVLLYYKIKLAVELLNMGKSSIEEKEEAKKLFYELFNLLSSKNNKFDISRFPPIIQFGHVYTDLLIEERNLKLANDVLNLCLSAIPKSIILNYKKANLYHSLKQYLKAIETFNKCLYYYQTDDYDKFSLNDPQIINKYIPYMIGVNFEFLKSYQVAKEWYEEVYNIDKDLLYLKEGLKEVNSKAVENKLSLCMIVKNQEKNIGECLKSVKNLVDEIVIVDIGSTDLTVEIAKKFGARVYNLECENNFNLAKNYCIQLALYNWILFLDADEILLTTKDNIKLLINDSSKFGYYISSVLKLFRNIPALRYEDYFKLAKRRNQSIENIDCLKEFKILHGKEK